MPARFGDITANGSGLLLKLTWTAACALAAGGLWFSEILSAFEHAGRDMVRGFGTAVIASIYADAPPGYLISHGCGGVSLECHQVSRGEMTEVVTVHHRSNVNPVDLKPLGARSDDVVRRLREWK